MSKTNLQQTKVLLGTRDIHDWIPKTSPELSEVVVEDGSWAHGPPLGQRWPQGPSEPQKKLFHHHIIRRQMEVDGQLGLLCDLEEDVFRENISP